MFDEDSEAAHMDEIYDGSNDGWTREETRAYLRHRANAFKPVDIGRFVVTRVPERNSDVMPLLYMADRTVTKRVWWTPAAELAIVFHKREAAEHAAARLKYGQVSVKVITRTMTKG